jgi:hypothetical protein
MISTSRREFSVGDARCLRYSLRPLVILLNLWPLGGSFDTR